MFVLENCFNEIFHNNHSYPQFTRCTMITEHTHKSNDNNHINYLSFFICEFYKLIQKLSYKLYLKTPHFGLLNLARFLGSRKGKAGSCNYPFLRRLTYFERLSMKIRSAGGLKCEETLKNLTNVVNLT